MFDTPQDNRVLLSLAPGVEFSTRVVGDRTSYVAFHANLGKYFRFGAEEHFAACLIDGERTAVDIHAKLQSSGVDWSPQDVTDFIGKLVQHKIVIVTASTSSSDAEAGAVAASENQTPALSMMTRITTLLSMVISQRIPLCSGQRIACSFHRTLGKLFSPAGTITWILLVMSALAVVYGHRSEFEHEIEKLFDPAIWPLLIGIWVAAKIVHEIGHAVAAYHHGVRIGQVGIMFFLFAPLAYVDVTDAWKLKSRMSRVQIALAGVYVELALAGIAAWIWWILPDGLLRHLSAQVFLITGPATLLVNANPLLRLDGYYVFSDMLEIPNLRMHGRMQLGGCLEKWLVGMEPPKSLLSGWRRPIATAHAAASVVFQFFWMGGLIIAISMWAQGIGVLLALSALLLWCLIPLTRWVHKIWMMDPPEQFWMNAKRKRLLAMASLLSVIVQYLSTTTSPLDRRVPVVVRYHDEQISRAVADSFVQAIHVHHGQRVEKGQLLLELEQPELLLERDSMIDDLELAKQRSTQYRRNGNIALADAKAQEAESLSRRIEELNQRVDGLQIFALRNGRVTTPNLMRMMGRYVRQGDELIRVSDPNEKEVLAVVCAEDMNGYQLAVERRQLASVRLRGGTHIRALPLPLMPRARVQLPHPAMSAMVGGPLAVRPSDDPNHPVQLVEPQLESVSMLDPLTSANVVAGQRGVMTISDDRPLVARLYEKLRYDVK